jgi:hypothetical protein
MGQMDGSHEKASRKTTTTSNSVRIEPHVLGTHLDGEEGKTDAAFETKGQGMLLLCSQEEGDCCSSRRLGESQNTFSWTGWMTGRMDGWKKLHDHDVLYYM